MQAIVYAESGEDPELRLVEREPGEPGRGEVRLRLVVAGVNPSDWKRRAYPESRSGDPKFAEIVPGQDGAGIVDSLGPEVDGLIVGDRVWTVLAQNGRPTGTAQEFTVLPADHVVRLPDDTSFALGASLGLPAVTAHRALTLGETGPDRLHPGALAGSLVLVAGGAGAVGHFAIQLARWAGGTVITTVDSKEKAALAGAAGAHHVVDYRAADAAAQIAALAPGGVDLVVEVAPVANAALDLAVAARNATVVCYGNTGGDDIVLPIRTLMGKHLGYRFFVLYTLDKAAIRAATEDVTAAIHAGALSVGERAGLPLIHYPLKETGAAHDAVRSGVVGKVLLDIDAAGGSPVEPPTS